MVYEIYKQYARPLARVVHGLQTSWDAVVAAVYDEHFSGVVAWSPCNRFIAVTKSGVVQIRDAITLNLIGNFESPSDTSALSFSPDSRFLTRFHRRTMVTWDLQTGVSVITASPEELLAKGRGSSPAYSMDGKMLAGEYFHLNYEKTFIITHDFSTTHTHAHRVSEGRMVSPLWTHGEFLRFATVKSGWITVWQAEFTFTHPPEAVESLPAPGELIEREASASYLFLPMTSRFAIALQDTLLVWDARDSKHLLKISDSFPYCMSFSSDGRFFACGLRHDKGIHIWKESPAGYIIHRKLEFNDSPRPLLSPNGESIIIYSKSIIRLLHTKDSFLCSGPTPSIAQHWFILNLFPSDALVAFVRYPQNIVTILDLQSGNPQLEIDTGMEVKCLGVAGDTVVVADEEKVVTWKLDTRNTRANIHDSIRITMFDLPLNHLGNPIYPMSVSSDLSRIIALSGHFLAIYDVSTGRCLTGPTSTQGALKPLSTQIQVH